MNDSEGVFLLDLRAEKFQRFLRCQAQTIRIEGGGFFLFIFLGKHPEAKIKQASSMLHIVFCITYSTPL